MYRPLIIFYFLIYSCIVLSQENKINEIFLERIITEDFNNQKSIFPTITALDGKYAIIIDSLGYYGLGSNNSPYPLIIGWENDLMYFELKLSYRLKNEENSFVLQKIQGETGQTIGIILKYNPDNQEALIFETNGVKQYRLSHLKNEKLHHLTNDWIFSENLNRNDRNEILIRTKNNKYEFYINGQFEYRENFNKIDSILNPGKFGFYIGENTQVMIDYFYISALENYNGINKVLNLSEEDAKILLEEKKEIQKLLNQEKLDAVKELESVIELLEIQLKSNNKLIDSLRSQNKRYEPFEDIINENGNFMYTLTKDLKNQMEKNKKLKNINTILNDSIKFLINRQEEFKLEYLRVIDSMMEQKDTLNE
ncbi:MAG: hypothetical protein CMP49_06505 [Flavobacteriales bacterium]|nr:hypothetical protein [Flavobacteriales bacterium]